MKRTFWTQNLFIGVLIGLVMVFGVSGIADALTLTRVSDQYQSKRLGSTFEITFSVGLTSPTIAYDNARKRVSDHNDQSTPSALIGRIDSSGYRVFDATNGREYRLSGAANTVTGGFVDRSARYTDSTPAATEATGTLYVDTGNNVVNDAGLPVYTRTGTGARAAAGTPADPYVYTRAKANPDGPIDEEDWFDFNEESISVATTLPDGTATTNVIITDKRDGQPATPSMSERSHFAQLRSSVTLVCAIPSTSTTPNPVGTYVVTIADTTIDDDFPAGRAPTNKQSITFTLYVTSTAPSLTAGTDSITATVTRVDTGDAVEPVSSRFTVAPPTGNHRVRYKVVEGNGTLYVGNEETSQGNPTPDLTVHQSTEVWINMNQTTNKVTATLQGGDPNVNSFQASVVFEYTGTDRRDPTPRTGGNQQQQQQQQQQTTTRGSLNISVSGTGTTRTVTVTAVNAAGVTAPGIGVTLTTTGGSLSTPSGTTPLTSTLTLPSTAGSYTLTASTAVPNYDGDTETITITLPGSLSLTEIGNRASNGGQSIRVTVREADGTAPSGSVTVTLSGVVNRTVPTTNGTGAAAIVLPAAGGTVTLRATGYNDGFYTFAANPQQQTQQQQQQTQQTTTTPTTTTTTGTAGVADSIEIDGDRQLSGTVNQALRLRVGVHDANDRGVSGVRVTFRVLAPGKGRLSQRGNGRAVIAETDRNGYATASLTPLGGNLIVEAKAAGVRASVTFIIDVDGAVGDTGSATTGDTTAARTYNVGDKIPISSGDTLTFRGSRTLNGITYTCVGSGECVVSYGIVVKGQIQAAPEKTTPAREYDVGDKIPISLGDTLTFRGSRTLSGTTYTCVGSGECVVSYGLVVKGQIRVTEAPAATTPTREINPEVLIAAANRPPMLWVDSGTIYALVGAEVQAFISGVEGAMNIAVSGNKVYWTEKTGESAGTINSANLDGSGAKELKSIMAVPMGIAVDTATNKLYWTNARGRIQSLNADGSGRVENVLQNLSGPMDIAIGRGNLYWTQYDATSGAGSLGIANSAGRGTPKYISTGSDMPGSLTIAGNKVYWTEMTGTSAGTINSATLSGTDVKQLAPIRAVPVGIAVDTTGGKLYWTNSRGRVQNADLTGKKIVNVVDGLGMPGDMVVSNSIKAPKATTTPPESMQTADYDYDVNGDGTVDVKDSDAVLAAVAASKTDAKYDVNKDGRVDIHDVVAVTSNRSAGAAGAPTLLGRKFSALEVQRLQEQIDLLVATGDRSPAAMRTLIYLQQLIAMARPEKTQLLANYPNPFNPETWIPYELATDTDVRLTIYNAQGVVIRVLQLGQQSAGYYTDRERAAYWDGRNALGEPVASGIYFYQLETDENSSLRKMVILK